MVADSNITEPVKRCSKCKEFQPLSAFSKKSSARDGLRSWCRICHNGSNMKYSQKSTRRIVAQGYKYCPKCQQDKPLDAFPLVKGVVSSYCQPCRNEWARQYEKVHPRPRKKRKPSSLNKIRMKQYQAMLHTQNGVCAICGKPETVRDRRGLKRLSIDHCHRTGRIRGLLCFQCNSGLGKFKDDPSLLANAIEYLTQQVDVVCFDNTVCE